MVLFWGHMPAHEHTICIIEDDTSFRFALERLMRASGIEARSFASAEEFLKSALTESWAGLILDLDLPGMSGLELVDHLSRSGALPPVIFITAQDDESLRERASIIPDTVYLRKPFAGAELLEKVRSLLNQSHPK
jgi:DNA-binding response OmpR family regulator